MMPDAEDFERIGRYLDGEMSPGERVSFDRELGENAELAALLDRLVTNDARMRAAYELPVDDAMLARLGLAPRLEESATAQVIDFNAERERRNAAQSAPPLRVARPWRWAAGGAIAAGIVALLAIPTLSGSPADPTASEPFQVAMESMPSAQRPAVGNADSITPTLSFADAQGRYCREFAIGGAAPEVGVACRNSQGRWQVEGRSAAPRATDDNGAIRTAAGDDGAALDRIYDRLGASDPYDAASEQRLLAARWRRATR